MPRRTSKHIDDPAAFGQRLRQAREAAGVSQRQLAFEGCSPAYISRIEKGDRTPSLQLIREFARRLKVSEIYLTHGREIQNEVTDRRAQAKLERALSTTYGNGLLSADGVRAIVDRALGH